MVKNETLGLYCKMKIWVNEVPDECKNVEKGDIYVYKANKDITWFSGTLCLELRIAPRAASNYAMLGFRFAQDDSGFIKIVYMLNKKDKIVTSDIAAPRDTVSNDIVKKYYEILIKMFDELSMKNTFPSGTLEILGGRCGSIGSSNIAVITVAKILIALFELGEKFEKSDINEIILEGCKGNL